MVAWRTIATVAALAACGGEGAPGDRDAGTRCTADCLIGWWTRMAGPCTAACGVPTPPRECLQADCEMLEARVFLPTSVEVELFPVFHSPIARTFTLGLPTTEHSWEVVRPCELVLDGEAAREFWCDDTALSFPTALFSRVQLPSFEAALETARAAGAPCEHDY